MLVHHTSDSLPLFIQNIIRGDILQCIAETSERLISSLNLSENLEYLLYVVELIKDLNQSDQNSLRRCQTEIFFRLADQVKDFVYKNEDNSATRISLQKEKIKVFGYFDYFVMEKENENVNWIFFTQFNNYFEKH